MRKDTLLITAIAFGLTLAGIAGAEDQPISEQIVDVMNKVFGVHPGFRANHAKGIVAEGHFTGAPEALGLSRAVLFNGSPIPVTVRFSNSTGVPNIPDGSPKANPHGIAIKYHLPGGGETDMVINSFKFFPVATGEDFRDLLLALAASPPDAAKPTKFDQFATSHPSVPAAFGGLATPDSFANEEYYGVNAFLFINKAGARQAVRYQLVPEHLVHLSASDAAKQPAEFPDGRTAGAPQARPNNVSPEGAACSGGRFHQGPVSSLAGRPQSRGAGRFDGRQSSARQC